MQAHGASCTVLEEKSLIPLDLHFKDSLAGAAFSVYLSEAAFPRLKSTVLSFKQDFI